LAARLRQADVIQRPLEGVGEPNELAIRHPDQGFGQTRLGRKG